MDWSLLLIGSAVIVAAIAPRDVPVGVVTGPGGKELMIGSDVWVVVTVVGSELVLV